MGLTRNKGSLLRRRKVRQLGAAHAIELLKLAADLFSQAFGLFVSFVFHFDFEEKIGDAHR